MRLLLGGSEDPGAIHVMPPPDQLFEVVGGLMSEMVADLADVSTSVPQFRIAFSPVKKCRDSGPWRLKAMLKAHTRGQQNGNANLQKKLRMEGIRVGQGLQARSVCLNICSNDPSCRLLVRRTSAFLCLINRDNGSNNGILQSSLRCLGIHDT